MSQGKNSSDQRETNERIILSLIRGSGVLSKPDITLATGLTYPAVARIVDDLEQQSLIKQHGSRKKGLGKPAALYEIDSDGKYALAAEITNQLLSIIIVDFHGNPVSSSQYPLSDSTPLTVAKTLCNSLRGSSEQLSSDQLNRIAGIGLIDSDSKSLSMNEVRNLTIQMLDGEPHHPLCTPPNIPVFTTSRGVAAAAAEALKNPDFKYKNVLYIFIDQDIDGCFIFSNKIHRQRPYSQRFLASMPIPSSDENRQFPAQTYSLSEQASLKSLQRDLMNKNQWPVVYTDLEEHTTEVRQIIANWIERTTTALAFAIESCASLHQLDEVILDSGMPSTWLATITGNIQHKKPTLCGTNIRSGSMGGNASIIGCAALLLTGENSINK